MAEEDTLCYLIKKEVFKKLLGDYPDVFLYFTAGPSKGFKQFDSGIAAPGSPRQSRAWRSEQVLFTGRVRDVMHTNVLTCPPEETVVGVARRMTKRGVGSVIVVDDIGVPMGIVTDGDLPEQGPGFRKLGKCPCHRRDEPAGPVHLARRVLL